MPEINHVPFRDLGESYMLTDHAVDADLQMDEYRRWANRMLFDGRERVLDWGCGFGHFAQLVQERGIAVELFDYEPTVGPPKAVQLTRYPHLSATVSSEEVSLPYADAEFDAVVSMGTLEHVHRPAESLAEIRRILRPGGYLYVVKLPNRTSYVEYLARKTGRYYHGALPNDKVYSLRSGEELVSSCGFAIVEARYMNMIPLMSLSRRVPQKLLPIMARLNRRLSTVPGLNVLATNVEIVAVRTS